MRRDERGDEQAKRREPDKKIRRVTTDKQISGLLGINVGGWDPSFETLDRIRTVRRKSQFMGPI